MSEINRIDEEEVSKLMELDEDEPLCDIGVSIVGCGRKSNRITVVR